MSMNFGVTEWISFGALTISIIALFFSGLVHELWRRLVSRPRLQASVVSIESGADEGTALPISLPRKLVQKSRLASLFPTIEEDWTYQQVESEIKKFEEHDVKGSLLAIKKVESSISELEDDESISEIWGPLSSDAKSYAYTLATTKAMSDKKTERLSAQVDAIVAAASESGKLEKKDIGRERAVQAFGAFKEAFVMLHTAPTAGLFRQYIEPIIPSMEEKVHFDSTFVEKLKSEVARYNAEDAKDYRWRLSVAFYNSGERSVSVLPVGAMVISNYEQEAICLGVVLDEEHALSSPCPPGDTVNYRFVSEFDSEKRAVLKAVNDDFERESRRFKLVFQLDDGGTVETSTIAFAPAGLSTAVRNFTSKVSLSRKLKKL